MRKVLFAILCLLSACTSANAQVVTGSSLFFDHTPEEQLYVERYQLCVDAVADSACGEIGVTRIGTTPTLTATLPAWVPKGRRTFTIRAIWKAPLSGPSLPTNTLTLIVVGGPERLRHIQD